MELIGLVIYSSAKNGGNKQAKNRAVEADVLPEKLGLYWRSVISQKTRFSRMPIFRPSLRIHF